MTFKARFTTNGSTIDIVGSAEVERDMERGPEIACLGAQPIPSGEIRLTSSEAPPRV
jgi:hypothetical protein